MPREGEKREEWRQSHLHLSPAELRWHDLKYRSGQDETRDKRREREKYLIYQTQSRFFTAPRHDRGRWMDNRAPERASGRGRRNIVDRGNKMKAVFPFQCDLSGQTTDDGPAIKLEQPG